MGAGVGMFLIYKRLNGLDTVEGDNPGSGQVRGAGVRHVITMCRKSKQQMDVALLYFNIVITQKMAFLSSAVIYPEWYSISAHSGLRITTSVGQYDSFFMLKRIS